MRRNLLQVGLVLMLGTAAQAGEDATVGRLLRMSAAELEAAYRAGSAASLPAGRYKGWPIAAAGRPLRSKLGRIAWQGKVVDGPGTGLINRFFGVRVVRAEVAPGASWLDGGAATIVDYEHTSRLYRPYRDEIRLVVPGTYLGLMYDRGTSPPARKMAFVLQAE